MKRVLVSSVLTGLFLAVVGCSHTPEPTKISNSSDVSAEITQQQQALTAARDEHVDVLAPKEFDGAKDYLAEAQDAQNDGEKKEEVFEKLGISKSFLQEAQDRARKTGPGLTAVTEARALALKADARKNLSASMKTIDDDMKAFTEDKEAMEDLKSKDKAKLEARYLGLELDAIKYTALYEVRNTLNEAKSKGAPRLVPNAYRSAEKRLQEAEKMIEADRHSNNRYQPAIAKASAAATQALSLVDTAQLTQGMTPEQRALTLQQRDKALREADELNAETTEESMRKDDELAVQGAVLSVTEQERAQLARREREDRIVAEAAKEFNGSEAEVYRQEDKLIIRLKSMKFSTGRADLPAASMPVLTKVKGVLKELNPEAVVVEGHTDAVGTAQRNQALSEKRAASVAQFLEADKSLELDHVDTAGFGYSRPISSNKTKEGRAENRRVDIIVTPSKSL